MDLVPAGRVSDLVGVVYDCAFDPAESFGPLGAFCAETDFPIGIRSPRSPPDGAALLAVSFGIIPDRERLTLSFGRGIPRLWVGLQRMTATPPEEPQRLLEVSPDFMTTGMGREFSAASASSPAWP